MKGTKLDLSLMEESPIQHSSLSASLMTCIEDIANVFGEIDERPVANWVEDFQRDRNPEKEITAWETMATVYSMFTKSRDLSLQAKKETLHLLLACSINDEVIVPNEVQGSILCRADVLAIMETLKSVSDLTEHEIA